ncbi:MAG: outer membrane protein assembly factor BamD [Gemmatimonadota bacterium]
MSRTASHPGTRARRRAPVTALLAAACLLAAGCSVALPPPDATPTERFEWSHERFEDGNYNDAIRGFRDLLFREPLHATTDSARYLLAESYLKTDQHLLAANEFRMLATSRPNSEVADDAQLGMCRSYWELSPSIQRDQEFTRRAIEACTRLIEFFPRSELDGEARDLIGDARLELAEKQVNVVGRWYYERKYYESAIIYFESAIRDFPDAPVIPRALAMLHDSYSQVGFLAEAEDTRELLLDRFPDSPEARELAASSDETETASGETDTAVADTSTDASAGE